MEGCPLSGVDKGPPNDRNGARRCRAGVDPISVILPILAVSQNQTLLSIEMARFS